jgi:dTDP-D-glucose 4,6-dehydratase
MKKIIISGGNGFIGTNLIIKLFEDKKNRILNIDLLSFDKIKKIIFIFINNFTFINIYIDYIK